MVRPDSPKPPVRIWFDTEFLERTATIDLLSIGMVDGDGREYYAVSSDCDTSQANHWVKNNVLPKIDWKLARPRKKIRDEILEFVGDRQPEFWGWYADYDWVVFCWLFGAMVDLPKGWPMFCRDVRQLVDEVSGNPRLPEKPKNEHHALADARWTRDAWRILIDRKRMLHDHTTDLVNHLSRKPLYEDRLKVLVREVFLNLPRRP